MTKKLIKAAGSSWGQRVTLLIIICVVMAVFQPVFFRPSNAMSILLAVAINGIMASGMLYTVLVGGMDLSVGSMAGLAACVVFKIADISGFSTNGFLYGCAIALVICLVAGYINGFFVTRFGLPAFVVTLAMRYILYGYIPSITDGFRILPPKTGLIHVIGNMNIYSIPMPIIIFAIIVIISAFVLGKTTYGRKLYAIGGNKNVANLVGIKSNRYIMAAYMVSSVLAGLGGVILASMDGQAGHQTGYGYEGNVLMALIVGGINLAGGEGGLPGAVFGALLVGIINNVLLLLGVNTDIQKFVQGVVILAAMTLNMYARRNAASGLGVRLKKQPK